MLVGAALFDADFLRQFFSVFGIQGAVGDTTRWPVFATLFTAFLALGVTLFMKEPPAEGTRSATGEHSIRLVLANIMLGARHVFTVRRVTLLLVAALLLDSFVRLFLTFASNYYRLITLPEVWNGILGAAVALLGFAVAPLARRMVGAQGAVRNFAILFVLVFLGLVGLSAAIPIYGVWVLLPLGVAMSGLQFFTSYYLNQWTDSAMRATVLSFRGVAFNLAYGAVGIAFAGLTANLRSHSPEASETAIFGMSLQWLPSSFLLCAGIVLGGMAILTKLIPTRAVKTK
jgi:hypothetical protein